MAMRNSELPRPFRDGNPALPQPKDNPRDVRAVNTAASRDNGVVTDALLNTLDYCAGAGSQAAGGRVTVKPSASSWLMWLIVRRSGRIRLSKNSGPRSR
jgi:hypothetical protein